MSFLLHSQVCVVNDTVDVELAPYWPTESGDVYFWGRSFEGQGGSESPVEIVPRAVRWTSKLPGRVQDIQCGSRFVAVLTGLAK